MAYPDTYFRSSPIPFLVDDARAEPAGPWPHDRRTGAPRASALDALRDPDCDLGARVEAQFHEHVLDVGVDRAFGDHQLARDALVREPGCEKLGDLVLALGQ